MIVSECGRVANSMMCHLAIELIEFIEFIDSDILRTDNRSDRASKGGSVWQKVLVCVCVSE